MPVYKSNLWVLGFSIFLVVLLSAPGFVDVAGVDNNTTVKAFELSTSTVISTLSTGFRASFIPFTFSQSKGWPLVQDVP